MTWGFKLGVIVLSVMLIGSLSTVSPALAEEKPQYGGIMKVAIQGDPPSLDMHQESTFLVMIPFGNVYNTLLKFDPHDHDKIVGDLAESWSRSDDGLTYTFKLRKGVKFHDGTDFTSADAKASWDKIVSPPKGTISHKKSLYRAVSDGETTIFEFVELYSRADGGVDAASSGNRLVDSQSASLLDSQKSGRSWQDG